MSSPNLHIAKSLLKGSNLVPDHHTYCGLKITADLTLHSEKHLERRGVNLSDYCWKCHEVFFGKPSPSRGAKAEREKEQEEQSMKGWATIE